MANCVFCDDFVGEENGDGGVKGRTIGNRDICEQCLGELKFWLNGTLAKSPGMRNTPLKSNDEDTKEVVEEEDSTEETSEEESKQSEEEDSNDDPFSSTPKI